MKKVRCIVALIAALAAGSTLWAAEPLVLMDFEGNDEGRPKGGEVTTEQAKTGQASLKWAHADRNAIHFEMLPSDWSPYNQLAFWAYSAVANNADFLVQVMANDDTTEGGDYYLKQMKVTWTGWKRIELPFWRMGKARSPLGWDQTQGLSFHANGWNMEPKEDTLLYIDDVRLEVAPMTLANPSMEDEDDDGMPDEWKAVPGPEGEATKIQMVDDGRTGRGVQLVDTSKEKGVGLKQMLPAEIGKTYTFSCWKKGDMIAVYLHFMKDGEIASHKLVSRKNDDPAQFEKIEVGEVVPEGTDEVGCWIYSYSSNTGTVVVDDCKIEVSD